MAGLQKIIPKIIIIVVLIVAVLAILSQIFFIPCCAPVQSPTEATKSLLQNLMNAPGTLQETGWVVFTQNTALAAETLAEDVGLQPSQICLDPGEYRDEERFELLGTGAEGNQIIHWTGVSDRKAKIAVVCASSSEVLNTYITDTYSDHLLQPTDCSCLGGSDRCCLVQLKRA